MVALVGVMLISVAGSDLIKLLGKFKDDPKLLMNAIKYLEKHK